MINRADLMALLPVVLVAATAIVLLLVISIRRHHGISVLLTVGGLFGALMSIVLSTTQDLPRRITPLLQIDDYSLFFTALLCASAAAVALFSYSHFSQHRKHSGFAASTSENRPLLQPEEFYVLLLTSTLGSIILVNSIHFVSFFLGLEVLSIPLIAMIAYPLHSSLHMEAGVKFLILTALASALLLFGMALIYAQSGSMVFDELARQVADGQLASGLYFIGGVMLLIAGVGFKLSLVPFHMWTPDIYQGAPTPVSAYVATVSKAAMFAVLLRYVMQTETAQYASVITALSAVAVASILVGNLLALLQNNIKRVLAYSSIAHIGYLLVVLLASKSLAVEAAEYFLVAYIVTNLGAFGIVSVLESGGYNSGDFAEYRGLFWHHPWLAASFTLMLLSLAGIPLTVGFVGKFYIIAAGVQHTLWLLVFTIVAGSAMGLFYYLRIVITLFAAAPEIKATVPQTVQLPGGLTLVVLTLMLLWLGIFPGALISIIQNTVSIV
jgi:NADH-quinone oxidoreductase subunit N